MNRDHSFRSVLVVLTIIGANLAHIQNYVLAVEPHNEQIEQLLEAGQLPAALQAARQVSRHTDRDPWLAKIAAAQSEQGDRAAAIQTLGEIYDHQSRWNGLRAVARSAPQGGQGGGAEADFESIIELMTATVQPDTWDVVGGPGAVKEFAGGVHVDPKGLLQRLDLSVESPDLLALKDAQKRPGVNTDVRGTSRLRKVSLPRLELQCQLLAAMGKPPTDAMRSLAGITRVEYLFVYPDSRDLVIAGPAGEWEANSEGRQVSRASGAPVLQLDDLVDLLRAMADGDQTFGCSITPRQEALAQTQAYLARSAKNPLKPGQRTNWLSGLRDHLGKQDIKLWGLDAQCRAAKILVEADYRMKLVGMGLEEPVLGVTSYLDSIRVAKGQAPPPMDVLRWWFTLNYGAIQATSDDSAFALQGQGVRVLSENELLTETGKRVHTGASDELNQAFAESFTQHFPALCAKYPIYAELRNIFDLALIAAVIDSRKLAEKADWRQVAFGPSGCFATAKGYAPTEVETVINSRVVNRIHIIAGVSGGVSADIAPLVAGDAIKIDKYGKLVAEQKAAVAQKQPRDRWWWD